MTRLQPCHRRSRSTETVRYDQLPFTLPINIDVPEHSSDDGTYTQSGGLQLHGKVTLSAVNSCLVTGAGDMEARVSAKTCPVKKNPKAKHRFKRCKGRNKAQGQPASNPLTCDQWLYLLAFRISEREQEIEELKLEAA